MRRVIGRAPSLSASFGAGTYDFSLCVRNSGTTDLNKNDWVNGTVVAYGPTR
jgi:hypothetical protein